MTAVYYTNGKETLKHIEVLMRFHAYINGLNEMIKIQTGYGQYVTTPADALYSCNPYKYKATLHDWMTGHGWEKVAAQAADTPRDQNP